MTKYQALALRKETGYEVIDDPHAEAAKLWAAGRVKKHAIDAETQALVMRMWERHAEQVEAANKVIAWLAAQQPKDPSDNQML